MWTAASSACSKVAVDVDFVVVAAASVAIPTLCSLGYVVLCCRMSTRTNVHVYIFFGYIGGGGGGGVVLLYFWLCDALYYLDSLSRNIFVSLLYIVGRIKWTHICVHISVCLRASKLSKCRLHHCRLYWILLYICMLFIVLLAFQKLGNLLGFARTTKRGRRLAYVMRGYVRWSIFFFWDSMCLRSRSH